MLETWSNLALLPFSLIGAFLRIGGIVLWFGMLWDCAFTSKMRVWSKVLWLLLLIATSGIGALVYYFCVYKNGPSGSPLAQDKQIPAGILMLISTTSEKPRDFDYERVVGIWEVCLYLNPVEQPQILRSAQDDNKLGDANRGEGDANRGESGVAGLSLAIHKLRSGKQSATFAA